MLSGDIEKSRLARVRRGLKHIKEGKGRNKSRDSSLELGLWGEIEGRGDKEG